MDEVKEEVKENNEKTEKKVKHLGKRTLVVFAVLILFFLSSIIIFRADSIEIGEIGSEYLDVLTENTRYKLYIGAVNFVIVFIVMYIITKVIKKGLKQFFDADKKEMPRFPNKSIALIVAIVSSIIISNLFLQKFILFANSAQFGTLNDPIFNMDAGFYMFKMPLIGQLAYYMATMTIVLILYTVVYNLIVLNVYFDGVDAETLKKSSFIKLLLVLVMVLVFLVAFIICFNVQNMVVSDGFLTLKNQEETTIIGSGAVETGIKLWGYRIFAFVIILSVYMAIRAFKKGSTKKVIKSLAIVPVYLVMLFVVMSGYNLLFIKGNELEKQKKYIETNIDYTKTAYDINLDEISISSTGTITEKEAEDNKNVINNIPIVTENAVINNLMQTQTNTGYYIYNGAKALIYNNNLVYISARELNDKNASDAFTHGYGAVIASSSQTDEAGNIKYISRDFENKNLSEPRIYYGISNLADTIVSDDVNEVDYPKGATENEYYKYKGDGGVSLGLLDKICVAIKEGNLSIALSGKDSKILLNRNVIDRAEKIIPYFMYDENPYLVINDEGELYWVIDAYTVSDEFPYSQKTKLAYKNTTKEINYIRNSVKVIVNAFDGETKFYITDKTDPIAMVYNNMYDGLFEDGADIPDSIAKYFTYPKFLYNIQSEIMTEYHDVSADVLYRGNDVWQIASYSNLVSNKGSTEMEPYYTMCKTVDEEKGTLGLINIYNQYGKESLNAYLVGTVEKRKKQVIAL